MNLEEMKVKYTIATKYEKGTSGYPKSQKKAFGLYEKIAQAGYVDAVYKVGYMCYEGKGTKCDLEKALEWFLLGAMQGHRECQSMCGMMYGLGLGTAKDKQKSVYYYEMAALADDVGSMYHLGVYYYLDEHIYEKSIYWLRKAIDHGCVDAKRMLAFVYTEMKNEKAKYWFEQSFYDYKAKADVGDMRSAYFVGQAYEDGLGIQENKNEAIKMYQMILQDGTQSEILDDVKERIKRLNNE